MSVASGLAILIPAAGASRRMQGRDKCLEEIEGEAALRRAARLAAATGARVLVTLPDSGPLLPGRQQVLLGLGVTVVPVKDAHEGMAASLRAGVRAAAGARGLMVVLPDMPGIGRDELQAVIECFAADESMPARSVAEDGTPGHPVIFPQRLFAEISVLTGEEGARRVLLDEEVRVCHLPGRRAVADLDTPEDWDRWRAVGLM